MSFEGGDILSKYHQTIIGKFMGSLNPKWKLIYKATRDGFRAADFHRLCDHQTQTVFITQSTGGYLFGGYAHAAWNSSNTPTNDPRAFIFTLVNSNSIQPTRYLIKGGYEQFAFYNVASYGPTFGGGHDIYIPDKSNETIGSITFGNTYTDTTGKGALTFMGNYTFLTSEIEVYKTL